MVEGYLSNDFSLVGQYDRCYFLNKQHFCDVIKYRTEEIQKILCINLVYMHRLIYHPKPTLYTRLESLVHNVWEIILSVLWGEQREHHGGQMGWGWGLSGCRVGNPGPLFSRLVKHVE